MMSRNSLKRLVMQSIESRLEKSSLSSASVMASQEELLFQALLEIDSPKMTMIRRKSSCKLLSYLATMRRQASLTQECKSSYALIRISLIKIVLDSKNLVMNFNL